jgi:hypothetical protein
MTKVRNVWMQFARLWVVALLIALPTMLGNCGSDSASTTPVATGGAGGAAGAAGAAGKGGSTLDAGPDVVGDTKPDTTPVTKAAMPAFSIPGATYQGAQNVQITSSTPAAKIYYTIDGSTPTNASPLYAAAIPLAVGTTTTIKAIAAATGFLDSDVATATYIVEKVAVPQAAAPTFTPPGGTFTTAQTVSIASASLGVEIHYTVDGNDPNAGSPIYAAPIAVSITTTIKAIAIHPQGNFTPSPISAATYTISALPIAAAPTFTPPGGTYTTAQVVTIGSTTPAATIYYTTDGSAPTAASTAYTVPINISSSMTLRAFATAAGYSNSAIIDAAYVIQTTNPPAAAPSFNPAGGTYTAVQTVTITTTTAGATIYYTQDGNDPTAGSPVYSVPIQVAWNQTLKAMAVAAGFSPSPITSATYTINLPQPQAVAPTITPNGGTFTAPEQVTIATAEPGGVILYTTDGTLPTAVNGQIYTTPFTVSASTTVSAITTVTGKLPSNPTTAVFTITIAPNQVQPAVVIPPSTTSNNALQVTMTSATPGATICYTVDGTAPTCAANGSCTGSSGTYNGATGLTVDGNRPAPAPAGTPTQVRAIACAAGLTAQATPTTATYTFQTAAATFQPINGGALPAGAAANISIQSTTIGTGVAIRYRTDGTAVTCSTGLAPTVTIAGGISSISVPPISVNTTFSAIVCKAEYTSGAVTPTAFTIALGAPTFGANQTGQVLDGYPVTVTNPTFNSTAPVTSVLCHTHGDTTAPGCTAAGACDANSALWTNLTAEHASQRIRVIACGPNNAPSATLDGLFTKVLSAITFSPPDGTNLLAPTLVSMSSTGAEFFRVTKSATSTLDCITADGSLPAGVVGYTGTNTITTTTTFAAGDTLRAIACDAISATSTSRTGQASYPALGTTASPQVTLPTTTNLFNDVQSITLTAAGVTPAAGVICFTTDGTDPACTLSATPSCTNALHKFTPAGTSTVETLVATGAHQQIRPTNAVLKAVACAPNLQPSVVTSITYTFTVGPITIAPTGTVLGMNTTLTATTVTAGVDFHMTASSSTSTPPGCITVPLSTQAEGVYTTKPADAPGPFYLQVMACKAGYTSSGVTTSGPWTFNAAPVKFGIPAGTYSDWLANPSTNVDYPNQRLTLTTDTSGAGICYTTGTSTPSCASATSTTCGAGSTLYAGPLTINTATHVHAITCSSFGPSGTTYTADYAFQIAPLAITGPAVQTCTSAPNITFKIGNASSTPPTVAPDLTGLSICYTSGTSTPTCTASAQVLCTAAGDIQPGANGTAYFAVNTRKTATYSAIACKAGMTSSAAPQTQIVINPYSKTIIATDGNAFATDADTNYHTSWDSLGVATSTVVTTSVAWDSTYVYLGMTGAPVGVTSNTPHFYIGNPALAGVQNQDPLVAQTSSPPAMTVFPVGLGGARWGLNWTANVPGTVAFRYWDNALTVPAWTSLAFSTPNAIFNGGSAATSYMIVKVRRSDLGAPTTLRVASAIFQAATQTQEYVRPLGGNPAFTNTLFAPTYDLLSCEPPTTQIIDP